ncbi:YhdP family protein [Brevirhabdus sp.]|uniref:YhdP family protein n=1 Tax=Brevirhabdus sp. TaxID=2004514 RepID=UPI00405A4B84
MGAGRMGKTGFRRAVRAIRALVLVVVATAVLVIGLAVALVLSGRSFTAPAALTQRVEVLANAALPDGAISIGAIQVALREDMSPTIHLSEVTLNDANGVAWVDLPDLRATLDREALWRGQIVPRELTVRGVAFGVTRNAQGAFDLDLAGYFGPRSRVDSLGEVLDQLRALMDRPALGPVDSVRIEDVRVTFRDQLNARSWSLQQGAILLNKDRDSISLDLGAPVISDSGGRSYFDLSFEAARATRRARLDVQFTDVDSADVAAQWGGLEWLQVLRAPISGQVGLRIDEQGGIGDLDGTLEIASGSFRPEENLSPIPFDGARVAFDFLPDEQKLEFDELRFRSDALTLEATGHVYVSDLLSAERRSFLGQIALSDLRAAPAEILPGPVAFDGGAMDFRLRLNPFRLDLGQLVLLEGDNRLIASGGVSAQPEGWEFALDASAVRLTRDRLMALWPVPLKTRTRDWLDDNILSGEILNARAAIRSRSGDKPLISYSFDFREARLRYLKTMPPLRRAQGHASVNGPLFSLYLEGGEVEAAEGEVLDAAGSVMRIPDLGAHPPRAEITLRARGPLRAALEMIDKPPLRLLSKADKRTDLATGRAEVEVDLSFELGHRLAPGEVDYAVTGAVLDVVSDALVPGRRLTSGRMEISATPQLVSIGGSGALDGIPIDATWTRRVGPDYAGRSLVEGRVELSPRVLRAFRVDLPDDSVSGRGEALFELSLQEGRAPVLDLQSDLRGIGLRVDPLNWRKPAADSAELALTVRLDPVPQVTRLVLDGGGLEAEGTVRLKADRSLDRVRLNRVSMGRTLSAAVDLVGRGAGRAPAVVVRGGSFDLRSVSGAAQDAGRGATRGDTVPMQVALDRLVITDKIALHDFQGTLDAGGGLNGTFTGRVNGGAAVAGTLVPLRGGTGVRITSRDAGAVLASADMYGTARDGVMELILSPTGKPGTYDGVARIRDVRIVDAPWIAELLSAISVVGLLEQLSAGGLHFSDVEAEFRLNPGAVIIKKGSAVGPSLGISVDGFYEQASGRIDLQGVVSPIYLLNGIGQLITRNREGLFGFSYRLTGTAARPRTSVNPLSILAPGFFRDLFRKPPPQVDE